ncbi:hypothetical protein AAC387_Pa03g3721 [Persea americana]
MATSPSSSSSPHLQRISDSDVNKSSISPMQTYHLQLFLSFLLFAFSLSSFSFILISLYRKKKKKNPSNPLSLFRLSLSKNSKKGNQNQPHPLFVEILTSNHPPKWASLERSSFSSSLPLIGADDLDGSMDDRSNQNGSEVDLDFCGEDCDKSVELKGKKKKKRGKKKRQSSQVEEGGREEEGCGTESRAGVAAKQGADCLYPFTSAASATQRKIKQHYDQLVKSNDAKALTMAQVGEFANCLIEARNELQHKSEIIQRKFTITKALLFKADRSSFDRLYQQIYKLEAEQKRLEEDASVYNRLQEQLKLSPAYKQMLEIAVRMELQAKSGELVESPETDSADISFEELLAQEKKDSFWQRNGKLRSCVS